MRAWECQEFGLDTLAFVERERPSCGPGQVLIEMKYASLNYRDLLTVNGLYNPKQKLPLIPCSDGSGVVVEVGDGVTRVKEGDLVCPIFALGWKAGRPSRDKLRATLGGPLDGTLCEYMAVDAESVVKIPAGISASDAATLPCAAVTAWHALDSGQVTAGDSVLVLGSGGVSIFALQFAKIRGARVFATTSSDEKAQKLTDLGAEAVINYREDQQWGKTIHELAGQGVDHVIEVGGAGTLKNSIRACGVGKTISLIGVLAGGSENLNLIPVLMQNMRIQGIIVGHREHFEDMLAAIDLHGIKPQVSDTFSFEDVPRAMRHMAEGKHFGKIVIEIKDS